MVFSKEDNAAWNDSEVMLNLEKWAKDLLLKKEEDGWEEESFEDALEEFETPNETPVDEVVNDESMLKDLASAYNSLIIDNLQKIANYFIDKSNIKTAYRIEQSINELKDYIWRRK